MRRYREGEAGDPVFERLLGIEMKREQYAQGAAFCDTVVELTDEATLAIMWDSAEAMPSLPEIEEPRSVARPQRLTPRRIAWAGLAVVYPCPRMANVIGELVAAAVVDTRVWDAYGANASDGIYLVGQPGPRAPVRVLPRVEGAHGVRDRGDPADRALGPHDLPVGPGAAPHGRRHGPHDRGRPGRRTPCSTRRGRSSPRSC